MRINDLSQIDGQMLGRHRDSLKRLDPCCEFCQEIFSRDLPHNF